MKLRRSVLLTTVALLMIVVMARLAIMVYVLLAVPSTLIAMIVMIMEYARMECALA